MARTFIDYKEGKGFEINEVYIQLAFCYIYQEAKKSQYIFSNKQEILESLQDDINGYLVLMWHDDLVNQSDEQTMLQVLQNVKTALQSKGAYISVAELQTIPTEDKDFKRFYGRYPFPTSELIKVIDALIQMLQGTWESTNYNMDINY
ncbi:hypothetical protein ACTS9T_13025 [Empedobacter falsenii]|uniref:hypothetical protein n=1 Tax=Empedobacter sp. GD03797 TaxID=2975382 RepID=UPI00244B5DE5|nr:hypothetical protein [Empedobacter sp. GD03797]MDH1881208.1 hypothetical protein [Empedobacter sp. GD03797]